MKQDKKQNRPTDIQEVKVDPTVNTDFCKHMYCY